MPEWGSQLRARLARLKFSPTREVEVVEELSQHLEDRCRELVAGGSTPDAATQQLLAEIADDDLLARRLAALRQAHRPDPIVAGVPKLRFFADLWQDLRYAARMLRRQPGFALAAIITLALGIGANTAIFSLVNATLLRRLPVARPEELAAISNGPSSVFSYPGYAAVRDQNDVFSEVFATGGIQASLNFGTDVDLVDGLIVTGNFFDTLGIRALLGRVIQRTDDVTPMGHPVVVIDHRLWQRRFGGKPDVLGHQVLLNGQPFTIVGVLGPDFRETTPGPPREIFVPMMMQPLMRPPRAGYSGEMNPDLLHNPNNGWLSIQGRLKPGVTMAKATTSLSVLAVRLDEARRSGSPRPANAPPPALPIRAVIDGDPGLAELMQVARLLFLVVGAVLLIACANVANLLLSRAAARRREVAVRLAVGASRWRLVRQLVTESLLLAGLGGLAGVALAWTLVGGLSSAINLALPFAIDFTMDGRVLLFALGVSMATGLVFGIIPAIRASRPTLTPALKGGLGAPGRMSRMPIRFSLKRALVVLQITASLVLLVTAGLLVRSLSAAEAINPGFDVDRLASTTLSINLLRYTKTQGRDFYRRVIEDVSHLPGVDSAAVARVPVASGGGRFVSVEVEGRGSPSGRRFQSENSGGGIGGSGSQGQVNESANANMVSADFFKTLGIPLLRGRQFSDADVEGSPAVAIVSEHLASTWFPGESAIGHRLSTAGGGDGTWAEIVGVVADSTYRSLGEAPASVVYFPIAQRHETGVTLYARTSSSPASIAGSVRRAIQAIEPNLPIANVVPVAQTVGSTLVLARTGTAVIAGFGILALVLAAVGIYGVLAFSMNQRRQEFGVRLALGATTRGLIGLVVREGMWLVIVGMIAGLAIAALGSRLLRAFLFGVSPTDAWTFVAVSTLLAAVALLACILPARRVLRVDLVGVLKGD